MSDRLLWLCLVVLVIVFIVQRKYFAYRSATAEGFANTIPNVDACPGNTKEINGISSVDCCKGKIVGGKCIGKLVCTLSERSGNLPRCVDYVSLNSVTKGIEACPMSMPNYFEKGGKSFCTKGALNRAKNGPVNQGEKTCSILARQEDNEKDPDSCFNQKMLEGMKFTIANVPHEKIIVSRRDVIVFGATYELNGRIETCLDRNSVERREDATNPGWRSDQSVSDHINSQNFCA